MGCEDGADGFKVGCDDGWRKGCLLGRDVGCEDGPEGWTVGCDDGWQEGCVIG